MLLHLLAHEHEYRCSSPRQESRVSPPSAAEISRVVENERDQDRRRRPETHMLGSERLSRAPELDLVGQLKTWGYREE